MLSHAAHGPIERKKAGRDAVNEAVDEQKNEISYNLTGVIFSQEEEHSISRGKTPIPCKGKGFGRDGASFDGGAVGEIKASIRKAKLTLET